MSSRLLRSGGAACAVLAATLLAGCSGASVSKVASRQITKAQAEEYAHAVNLRPRDMQGFTPIGSETEAPAPGRYGLEYSRCHGGVSPARRIVNIQSPEYSAGRAFYGQLVKSLVEVWPTPALVALNNARSHSSRGRACFVRLLDATNRQINEERKGRSQIGPFTVNIVSNPLPGVSHSFLTAINETRLLRTGAIRAHIYRDIFGFVTGPVEVELEAIGVGHPVPAPTEERALLLLLHRAKANTMYLRSEPSS